MTQRPYSPTTPNPDDNLSGAAHGKFKAPLQR